MGRIPVHPRVLPWQSALHNPHTWVTSPRSLRAGLLIAFSLRVFTYTEPRSACSKSVESKPAGDRDGTVWRWRAEGVGKEGEGRGAFATGAVSDAEVAGAALRECAAF